MSTGTRGTLSLALQEVLADIEEFLRDHHDVVDGPCGALPNQAMQLSRDLKEALGELP